MVQQQPRACTPQAQRCRLSRPAACLSDPGVPARRPSGTVGVSTDAAAAGIACAGTAAAAGGASADQHGSAPVHIPVFTVIRQRDGYTARMKALRATIGRSETADVHMGGEATMSRIMQYLNILAQMLLPLLTITRRMVPL